MSVLGPEGYLMKPTPTERLRARGGSSLSKSPDLAIDIKMRAWMAWNPAAHRGTDLPVIFLTSKDDEIRRSCFGLKMNERPSANPSRSGFWSNASKGSDAPGSARDGGQAPSQQARSHWSAVNMDQERHTCTWKGRPVTLTVTEFLILHSWLALMWSESVTR